MSRKKKKQPNPKIALCAVDGTPCSGPCKFKWGKECKEMFYPEKKKERRDDV